MKRLLERLLKDTKSTQSNKVNSPCSSIAGRDFFEERIVVPTRPWPIFASDAIK